MERADPFKEFKQQASFVTVELKDGQIYEGILLILPNQIGAMDGHDVLPFDPLEVTRVYQTNQDLRRRSSSNWTFWL
jgi:hypothetical protein